MSSDDVRPATVMKLTQDEIDYLNAECEHGHQRRKCPHCELAEAYREQDALRAEVAELRRRITWKDGVIRELFRIATESPDIEAWRLGATHMTAESWTEPDADWTPEE